MSLVFEYPIYTVWTFIILGGWEGSANFKIDFPHGGAIKFAETFQNAVKTCKII